MLTIDLNNPAEFTFENVRTLIASGDNSRNTQFMITNQGILSIVYEDEICMTHKNLFGSMYFLEGNNCIGPEAAFNDDRVKRTYSELKKIRDGMQY